MQRRAEREGRAMTRAERSARLIELGIVPVVRAPDGRGALELAQALFVGGIHCLEIALTVPGACEVIATLRRELGSQALIGAGTVTSTEEAQSASSAGAEFLVCPGCLPAIVPWAHREEVPVLLGALTPTEVILARDAGADFIELFPANALGGGTYLTALLEPFPDLRFVPTGGVTLQNLGTFLAAGAIAVGVGTALADHALLEESGALAVVELARRYQAEFTSARRNVRGPASLGTFPQSQPGSSGSTPA